MSEARASVRAATGRRRRASTPTRPEPRRGRKATHAQYCPVARTLDLLGDRWSLLVLRELMFGDRRFSDLRAELVGISPTLLTERLQALTAAGLVATRELPPPAARTVYTVTPDGRASVPILQAMARFGMALLAAPTRTTRVRPEMAVYGAVTPFFDPDAAAGVDEVYRLVVDGKPFTLATARGTRAAADRAPSLTLTTTARALVDARRGDASLADAIARGAAQVEGPARALRTFQRIYRLA